jgi:LacI family transcriptional regulator
VSTKTVSRVLNKEKYVSQELRGRVEAAVRKLKYSPNIQARGLASSRSFMVGLFVDDVVGDYIDRIQSGMLRACGEEGSHLVMELLPQRGTPETVQKVWDLLSRVNFDGILLTPPVCDDMVVLRCLREFGVPVVRIAAGRDAEDMGLSVINDYAAAREMTNYLINKGHRSIGFVKGDPNHDCSRAREMGYVHAMQEAGLRVDSKLMLPGEFSFASGLAAGRRIRELDKLPTAFFVSSDIMAAGVADVLKRAGIRVPEDVSLAGFDDDAICIEMSPQLTTIHQPVTEMAYEATTRVIAAVQGKVELRDEPVVFDYRLVERESVATISG